MIAMPTSQEVLVPLLLTLKVAGWATLLATIFGIAIAFALARLRFPGREVLDAMMTLPMVMPPTVLGYYLLVLVGRRGVIGEWLYDKLGITLIFTWQGAVIAAAVAIALLLTYLSGGTDRQSRRPTATVGVAKAEIGEIPIELNALGTVTPVTTVVVTSRVAGIPNVGKSTFVNTLAQAERMIVSEVPGTTRDSVDVRYDLDGKSFIAIDTPGLRRTKSITTDIDFYSTHRAQHAH
jgi:ABC-type tungstate transport system substrate-binding protein